MESFDNLLCFKLTKGVFPLMICYPNISFPLTVPIFPFSGIFLSVSCLTELIMDGAAFVQTQAVCTPLLLLSIRPQIHTGLMLDNMSMNLNMNKYIHIYSVSRLLIHQSCGMMLPPPHLTGGAWWTNTLEYFKLNVFKSTSVPSHKTCLF